MSDGNNETPDAERDDGILNRVDAGETGAFNILVGKYAGAVRGVIFSIVGSREVAEDICQDAFLVAFRSYRTLENRHKFGSWLYSIARYQSYEYNRTRSRLPIKQCYPEEQEAIRDVRAYADPEARLDRSECVRRLREAIVDLPADFREVIELRFWRDMKVREIADFLDIPESTVKWRLYKARCALREELEAKLYWRTI